MAGIQSDMIAPLTQKKERRNNDFLSLDEIATPGYALVSFFLW
jgi:hypothetical protein